MLAEGVCTASPCDAHQVGMTAINDSFILRSCVSWLLQRTFGSEKCYLQLVEMFRVVTLQTELGQLLDLTSAPASGGVDLSRFTIERYVLVSASADGLWSDPHSVLLRWCCSYNKIVKYKTAFYSFYLPVACGMVVAYVAPCNSQSGIEVTSCCARAQRDRDEGGVEGGE